jgi:uncharacterized membrane protein
MGNSLGRGGALVALVLAGCATTPGGVYRAQGYEPGWSLEIGNGRIVYLGDYGTVRIEAAAVPPRPTTNGYRYDVRAGGHSLTIDVTHTVCYGASGAGYADTVSIVADGRAVNGCGGKQVSGTPA